MATYTNILGSLLVASVVAVTGCGTDPNTNNTGGSGGEGGGGSNALTLDELGKKLVELNCAKSAECNNAESTADCVATSEAPIGGIKPYVENGTVVYHPENVAACLELFGGLGFCSYSELNNAQASQEAFQKACEPVFIGTIADGADCFTDDQCVSRSCASDPACMMQCCPGKCAAKVAPPPAAKIGESCAVADCEAGAYCQSDMMGDPTTCAAQAAMGQPCSDFAGCKSPAACDIDFMTGMGVCNVPAAHGAACNPMSFLACDRFDDICDATSKTCVTKGTVGADCSMIDCVDYAFCDMATMKCVKGLAEGATCDKANDNCLGELRCLDTGKCGFDTVTACK